MRIAATCAALLLALSLAACGSSPERKGPSPTDAIDAATLQDLPPHSVHPRQCSLVLFTRTAPARRIALGLDNPAVALVQVGGRTLTLARAAMSGAALLGHAERQTYAGEGAELVIDVRFEALSGPSQGAAVRSGTVAFSSPSRATTINPVVGLLSCGAQGGS